MSSISDEHREIWYSVIGRSLAFISLHIAELRDKDLATQAKFLDGLGLPRQETAKLLGTSEDSLRVLLRRAKTRRGGKREKREESSKPGK